MSRSHTSTRILLISGCLIGLAGCADGKSGVARTPSESWIGLINGEDLTGWKPLDPANNTWQVVKDVKLDPADHKHFVAVPGKGVILNSAAGKTSNILSERSFGDCEVHIEWVVPQESNSGVYFEGQYEIQILDSFGRRPMEFSDAGGIYAEWINNANVNGHAPRVNASRAPGEWQTFEAVFRAPRFDAAGKKIQNARFERVLLNGTLVHENVDVKGPTRAALPGAEKPEGPFMLQGDHGPVAFRNFRVRPLK